MSEMKTIELTISSEDYIGNSALLAAIEAGLKDIKARVLSAAESAECPMCGKTAKIETLYGSRRRRWWEVWRNHLNLDYSLRSDHPCYLEAAEKFATADSPWKKTVDTWECYAMGPRGRII